MSYKYVLKYDVKLHPGKKPKTISTKFEDEESANRYKDSIESAEPTKYSNFRVEPIEPAE